MSLLRRTLPGLVLALLPALAEAVSPAPVVAEALLEGEAVVIDGLMDEAVWGRAQVVDEFVGVAPTEGFEPRGETRVRVATDSRNLYLFFEARFDEQTRVRAYIAEREDINRDDQVAVQLDPWGDGRRGYLFWMNAFGVQQDLQVTLAGSYNFAWDAVFRSQGRIVDGGYDVEVAIPFRSLRFPEGDAQDWRIMLKRKFPGTDEYVAYPPVHRDDGPELLQYAELQGIDAGRSGIGLELLPTLVARTGQDLDPETDRLTWRKPGFPDTVDPGFGLKWQATPSMTLDATVNPDFSQIEADPNQIDNNLRFALSLPEKRPFFLEGRELYNGFLLYSRSIVDPIYGIKLSGKQGQTSVAILHALDEAPSASVVGERETPGFMPEDVDGALAFVTHAEARVDLGRRSSVAMSFSDKELLRDGEHHAQYHALNVDGLLAIDEVSQIDAAVMYSVTGRVGETPLHGPAWYAEYARTTRLTGFGAGTAGSTNDARSENGFFTQPGLVQTWGWLHHRFELAGPVSWVDAGMNLGFGLEGLDQPKPIPSFANVAGWASVRLPGLTDVRGEVRHWDGLFAGKDFSGGNVSGSVTNNALDWLVVQVSGSAGDTIRFSDATQTLGRNVHGSLSLRGLRRVKLDLSSGLNVVGRQGETINRLWIYRVRTGVGITRALSVRVILQGRNGAMLEDGDVVETSPQMDLSALVTLVPSPGTSIHVGFGERWSWAGKDRPETTRRDLFLKGSLLIRL